MKGSAASKPLRVVVIGDTCVSEQGLKTIVSWDKQYTVCGSAHGFYDAEEMIERHRPDVLLIEPFLEDRDGIVWIKDLAKQHPKTRILIVSRQSERIYAERALEAGAAGYWMKNGSSQALLNAMDAVASGHVYASPAVTSMIVQRRIGRGHLPKGLDGLSDRELAVFSLVAAEKRPGEIAKQLGISRKTIHTHCERIKDKLGYENAEELKRGARHLFGEGSVSARRS